MNRFLVYAILILVLSGCAANPGASALKRGMRALEKGRYAESITRLERSLRYISADDERSMAFNGLGISHYKLGHEKNAVLAFESAIQANPGAVEPIYNMGIVSLETGNEDKAIACFEKALLLDEQAGPPAQARPGSSTRDTRPLEFLAVIYSRRQQWDDARRVLNEAARHTNRSPRVLTALAVTELKANNISQASGLLQEALEQDAHYAPAIYNLAVINQHYLHKRDQALPLFAEYARLVAAGPQADQARLIIKEMKRSVTPPAAIINVASKSQPSPATKTVSRAETAAASAGQIQQTAAAQPASFPSFEELMQVAKKLEEQGRREAAFNNYLRIARAAEQAGKTPVRNQAVRHAVSLAEDNPQAAYDLGIYFLERNRKDEAFTYLKAATDQNDNPHAASMALAKLALEKGEYDVVIVSLKKADHIKPDNPEAIWLLADFYDRYLCISNSAASAYAQFAERFPMDRRSGAALSRLKILNPELKPQENVPAVQDNKSRHFWQRMFKSSVTNQ